MFNEMLNVYHIVDKIAITIFVKIINLLLPICAAYLTLQNITNLKKINKYIKIVLLTAQDRVRRREKLFCCSFRRVIIRPLAVLMSLSPPA